MASDETEKLWRFLLHDEPMMNNYILCLSKLQRRSLKCVLQIERPASVCDVNYRAKPIISCLKLQFDLSKNRDKMKVERRQNENWEFHWFESMFTFNVRLFQTMHTWGLVFSYVITSWRKGGHLTTWLTHRAQSSYKLTSLATVLSWASMTSW